MGGGSASAIASFNVTDGNWPQGDLTLSGGSLYGTTYFGPNNPNAYGVVFSVPASGGDPTVLGSFNGSNGEYPYGGLTLSDSTLYGTTVYGGDNGDGTVFSIPVSGGVPTALASFDGSNGTGPFADLTLSGGTLFGTTQWGGANNSGTVFAVNTPEPSTFVTLFAGLMCFAAFRWQLRRKLRQ